MRGLRRYAVAVPAVACVALGLFAGTASAQTPLDSCGSEVCLYNNYNGNISDTLSCVPAINLSYTIPVDVIKNHCQTRVWLHQHANGSGGAHCVSPGASATFRGSVWELDPGNIQVSSNPNNC